MIVTKFCVSNAHVALQEVIHLLHRLLFKFCWLQKTNKKKTAYYEFFIL